jgi:hypothetical protein
MPGLATHAFGGPAYILGSITTKPARASTLLPTHPAQQKLTMDTPMKCIATANNPASNSKTTTASNPTRFHYRAAVTMTVTMAALARPSWCTSHTGPLQPRHAACAALRRGAQQVHSRCTPASPQHRTAAPLPGQARPLRAVAAPVICSAATSSTIHHSLHHTPGR